MIIRSIRNRQIYIRENECPKVRRTDGTGSFGCKESKMSPMKKAKAYLTHRRMKRCESIKIRWHNEDMIPRRKGYIYKAINSFVLKINYANKKRYGVRIN